MRVEIKKLDVGYQLTIDYDGKPTAYELELIRGVQTWFWDGLVDEEASNGSSK